MRYSWQDMVEIYHKLDKTKVYIPYCDWQLTTQLCRYAWFKTNFKRWTYFYKLVKAGNMSEEEAYLQDAYLYEDQINTSPMASLKSTLFTYIFPFYLIICLLSTPPCLVLLNRYSNNVWSPCFYVVILFIIDFFDLYFHCCNKWIIEIAQVNLNEAILTFSNSVCKVYTFLNNLVPHLSSWVVVCLSVEVLIAIKYPQHMYRMSTKERCQAIILFVTVLHVCLNLHYFWTVGLSEPGKVPEVTIPYCHSNYELSEDFREIWPYIDTLVQSFLPFLAVGGCLGVSFVHMIKSGRQDREENETLLEKYFLDLKTLHHLKNASFIMCVFFLIYCLFKITHVVGQKVIQDYELDVDYNGWILVIDLPMYAYLSLKPLLFIQMCPKLRQDMWYCAKNFCLFIFNSRKYCKPRTKKSQDISPPQDGQSIDNIHVASKANKKRLKKPENDRPQIYKATGIGTSTGV